MRYYYWLRAMLAVEFDDKIQFLLKGQHKCIKYKDINPIQIDWCGNIYCTK